MRPLVPVLFSFIAGIITGASSGFSYETTYVFLAISFLPPVFSYLKGFKFNHYVAAMPFFFLGSLFILPYVRPELPPCHIKNLVKDSPDSGKKSGLPGTAVEGMVLYPPEFTNGRTRLYIGAERIFRDNGWETACGKILLTAEGHEDRFGRGDRVRFIARLREPFNYGNPGEFDYRWSLNRRGIFVAGYVKSRSLMEKTGEEDAGIARYIDGARSRIRGFIDRSGVKNGELIKALIIAESGGIDRRIRDEFASTGTVHILVIAGLHVGFVALFSYGAFLFLLKRREMIMLRFNVKKAAAVLTVFPVFGYGLLAGFPVSTKRAVIMVIAFTASFLLERGKDLYNTLALAAILILLVYPYSLWEASFQLSFAAVFFIIYLMPRFEGLLKGEERGAQKPAFLGRVARRRVIPAFFVTLAASLGTSPILAYHFHRVSAVGLAANLVAVPIAGIILPLILASVAISPFWEGLARIPLHAASAGFEIMIRIIKFFSALPYASVWIATPTAVEIILFYALVICAANTRKKRICAYLAPVILLAMFIDWGWWTYGRALRRELKVTFLSVGRGESELVEFPGGAVMLIGGGGRYGGGYDTGERAVAPALWSKKIKKIDYMVLSRPQYGPMGALKFIAGNFSVKEFWWNGVGSLGGLGRILSENNVRIKEVGGQTGRVEIGGATVEVLNPGSVQLDSKNMSLVLRITYGNESFLFTGDIGEDAERELVKKDIRAVVLQAPDRGSRNSSSIEFLRGVSPSIVVVGAAPRNIYGYPHAEALERYGQIGAKVLRTDECGAVTLSTDGKDLRVVAYLTQVPR